jgi:hypothetical protein
VQKKLVENKRIDTEIGRKLPNLLHTQGFINIKPFDAGLQNAAIGSVDEPSWNFWQATMNMITPELIELLGKKTVEDGFTRFTEYLHREDSAFMPNYLSLTAQKP